MKEAYCLRFSFFLYLLDSFCHGALSNCGYVAECGFESNFCGWTSSRWTRTSIPPSAVGPTAANSGSFYAYYISGTNAELITPEFAANEGVVSFYYQMYGSSSMGSLRMATYSNETAEWTTQFSRTGNQGEGWKFASYAITSSFSFVRFTTVYRFGFYTEIAIDDLNVSLPACTYHPTPVPTTPDPSSLPTPSPTFPPSISLLPTSIPTVSLIPSPAPTLTPVPTPVPTMECVAGQYFINSVCVDCPIGRFSNSSRPPYPTSCTLCAAGYYVSSTKNTDCLACATGKLSNPTRTACRDCEAGQYSFNSATCVSCEPGRYAPRALSDACFKCNAGYHTDNVTGSTLCTACDAGRFSTFANATCSICPVGTYSAGLATSCIECEAGEFSNITGSATCSECAAGSYTNLTGSISCIDCAAGRYQPATSQTECFDCAKGKYQGNTGSLSCATCPFGYYSTIAATKCLTASSGYYLLSTSANATAVAAACPANAFCFGAHYAPAPLEGYWSDRSSYAFAADIYECPRDTCKGYKRADQPFANFSCWSEKAFNEYDATTKKQTPGTASFKCDESEVLCHEGATGRLCGSCEYGYIFRSESRRCEPCEAAKGKTFIVIGFGASLCAVGIIILVGWRYVPCFKRQSFLRFLKHIDTGSVKVTWVTYQIIASTSFNLDIEYPSPFQDMIGVFNFFSLDFLALECFQDAADRYFTSVVLWSMMPLCLALLVLGVYGYRIGFLKLTQESEAYRNEQAHFIYVQHFWMFLLLTYIVLPPVAQKQFQSLDCIPFKHDGGSYLRVDTAIDCNGDDYLEFRAYIIFLLCFYQLIPLFWFWLLWNKRDELNPAVSKTDMKLALYIRDKDVKLAPLRFLFDSYKVDKWWFEVAEMYRRIMFVSIIPLTSNNKATRASLGCVLGVASMLYYREVNPFRRSFTNVIAYAAQGVIFITYYGALSIATGVMMSFGLTDLGIGICLVSVNITVFALLLYISFTRLRDEQKVKATQQAKANDLEYAVGFSAEKFATTFEAVKTTVVPASHSLVFHYTTAFGARRALKSGIPAHDVLGGVLVSTRQPHQLTKYDEAVFRVNASFMHESNAKQNRARSFEEKRDMPCDFEAVLALKLSTLILQAVDFNKFEIDEEDKADVKGTLGEGLYLIPVDLMNAFRPTRFSAVLEPSPWADGILLLPPTPIIRAYQLMSDQAIEAQIVMQGGKRSTLKDMFSAESETFARNVVYHSKLNQSRVDSMMNLFAPPNIDKNAATPRNPTPKRFPTPKKMFGINFDTDKGDGNKEATSDVVSPSSSQSTPTSMTATIEGLINNESTSTTTNAEGVILTLSEEKTKTLYLETNDTLNKDIAGKDGETNVVETKKKIDKKNTTVKGRASKISTNSPKTLNSKRPSTQSLKNQLETKERSSISSKKPSTKKKEKQETKKAGETKEETKSDVGISQEVALNDNVKIEKEVEKENPAPFLETKILSNTFDDVMGDIMSNKDNLHIDNETKESSSPLNSPTSSITTLTGATSARSRKSSLFGGGVVTVKPIEVEYPVTLHEYLMRMKTIRRRCHTSNRIPLYHYTQSSVAPMILTGGLRMSRQGQGDGGVYFSTLGPCSYGLGKSDEDTAAYEDNIIKDCFGVERLHEYKGKGKLSVVIVYGITHLALQPAAGGRDNAKVVAKGLFQDLSLPHSNGDFFLHPSAVLGAFLLDPQNPPSFDSLSNEVTEEVAKDTQVRELIENHHVETEEKVKEYHRIHYVMPTFTVKKQGGFIARNFQKQSSLSPDSPPVKLAKAGSSKETSTKSSLKDRFVMKSKKGSPLSNKKKKDLRTSAEMKDVQMTDLGSTSSVNKRGSRVSKSPTRSTTDGATGRSSRSPTRTSTTENATGRVSRSPTRTSTTYGATGRVSKSPTRTSTKLDENTFQNPEKMLTDSSSKKSSPSRRSPSPSNPKLTSRVTSTSSKDSSSSKKKKSSAKDTTTKRSSKVSSSGTGTLFAVGDRVLSQYHEDSLWYSALVIATSTKGYSVRYVEFDGYEEYDKPESQLKPSPLVYAVGDRVLSQYHEDNKFYASTVIAAGTRGYAVRYDEYDGYEEYDKPENQLKSLNASKSSEVNVLSRSPSGALGSYI